MKDDTRKSRLEALEKAVATFLQSKSFTYSPGRITDSNCNT